MCIENPSDDIAPVALSNGPVATQSGVAMDPPNGYELVTFLLVEAGILGDINMYKYLSIHIQLIISYNIRTYISIHVITLLSQ